VPNYNTLKKRKEFLMIWKKGEHYHSPNMIVQVIPSENLKLPLCHIGITCSSKVGGAVVRNKIKRQIRSIIVSLRPYFIDSLSYVIIMRKSIRLLSFANMEAELCTLLKKIQRRHVQ